MTSEGYRERLNQERASVLSNLGVKYDALAQSGRVAEEDQAQITHDEFVSMRINLLEYNKLKMLNEALERLAGGEYGVCDACGSEIPRRRLEIVPWAKYCVHCQDEHAAAEQEEWRPVLPQ